MTKESSKRVKKILVTGPESSGKSTLAEGLARKLNSLLVPEYAREYLEARNGLHTEADLDHIAKTQLRTEENMYRLARSEYLILDTSALVLKIWYRDKFGKQPEYIDRYLEAADYHMVLLCKPNIPWVADPLREDEQRRDLLYERYLGELKALDYPYGIVDAPVVKRLEQALRYLDLTFST